MARAKVNGLAGKITFGFKKAENGTIITASGKSYLSTDQAGMGVILLDLINDHLTGKGKAVTKKRVTKRAGGRPKGSNNKSVAAEPATAGVSTPPVATPSTAKRGRVKKFTTTAVEAPAQG